HVSRVTALGALTASIAHEVNQPLTAIISNAELNLRILDAASPDLAKAREVTQRTVRDGKRAAQVITRLRQLFSKQEFTLESLDVTEGVREVVDLLAGELTRSGAVLTCELAPDLPFLTADRVQLEQVVLNLIRNASDAMTDVHDRPRTLTVK